MANGRRELAQVLASAGERYDRQVVIVQPALRRALYEEARQDAEATPPVVNANLRRMRQLDALLLGIEASCGSLGARLTVIGDAR
jgi:hypothetical protein